MIALFRTGSTEDAILLIYLDDHEIAAYRRGVSDDSSITRNWTGKSKPGHSRSFAMPRLFFILKKSIMRPNGCRLAAHQIIGNVRFTHYSTEDP